MQNEGQSTEKDHLTDQLLKNKEQDIGQTDQSVGR